MYHRLGFQRKHFCDKRLLHVRIFILLDNSLEPSFIDRKECLLTHRLNSGEELVGTLSRETVLCLLVSLCLTPFTGR